MIYTIGHGRKTHEELFAELRPYPIKMLVDVRSSPYSKFNPQWNKPAVEKACEAAGYEYAWMGKFLGGLSEGDTVKRTNALARVAMKSEEFGMALMCSEDDPEKCHRKYDLAVRLEKEFNCQIFHISKFRKVEKQPTLF